jgi:hypothetical protein
MTKHPKAIADRLRTATQSLSNPQDLRVAEEYIRELEAIAKEQEAADASDPVSGFDRPFMLRRPRSRASASEEEDGVIGTDRAH